MGTHMRKLLSFLASLGLLGMSELATSSTAAPASISRSSLAETSMQHAVRHAGYSILSYKTSGVCFEIEGLSRHGQAVLLLYNPVDGSVARHTA